MIDTRSFREKVFTITGSSRGIGYELANQVLQHGGKVLLNGRDEESLIQSRDALRQRFGDERVQIHCGDISQNDISRDLIQACIQAFGSLDVLITNAGLTGYGRVRDSSARAMKHIIDVNIYGVLFPVKHALPHLETSGGQVLIVSTLAAIRGLPVHSAYGLSKRALTSLVQSLRLEEEGSGIHFGIAFVGFTANESMKQQYRPDGEMESLPPRDSVKVSSREVTAARLLTQVRRRRKTSYHTPAGKFLGVLQRVSPGFIDWMIRYGPLPDD